MVTRADFHLWVPACHHPTLGRARIPFRSIRHRARLANRAGGGVGWRQQVHIGPLTPTYSTLSRMVRGHGKTTWLIRIGHWCTIRWILHIGHRHGSTVLTSLPITPVPFRSQTGRCSLTACGWFNTGSTILWSKAGLHGGRPCRSGHGIGPPRCDGCSAPGQVRPDLSKLPGLLPQDLGAFPRSGTLHHSGSTTTVPADARRHP